MKNTLKVLLVLALCFVTVLATVSCGGETEKTADAGNENEVDVTEPDAAEVEEENNEAEVEEKYDISTAVLEGHEEMPFEEAMKIYEAGLLEYAADGFDEISLEASWIEGWSGEGAPDDAELFENEKAYTYAFDAVTVTDGEEEANTMSICLCLNTETNVFTVKGVVYTVDGEHDYSYTGDMAVEDVDSLYEIFVDAE